MTAKERLRELVEALPEARAAEWCARIEREENWTTDDFRKSLDANRPRPRAHAQPVPTASDEEITKYEEMLRDLDSYRPERKLFS